MAQDQRSRAISNQSFNQEKNRRCMCGAYAIPTSLTNVEADPTPLLFLWGVC